MQSICIIMQQHQHSTVYSSTRHDAGGGGCRVTEQNARWGTNARNELGAYSTMPFLQPFLPRNPPVGSSVRLLVL
jgi:hypothetical protein